MNPKPASVSPFVITIFGITGDLSRKKLLPAIFDLYTRGDLPDTFTLIGYGRRNLTRDDFANLFQNIQQETQEQFDQFFRHCRYIQGEFDAPDRFSELARVIGELAVENQELMQLFYFATAPEFFGQLATQLAAAGLAGPASRIILEKPFGHDVASAVSLNQTLANYFQEKQIYRIDHYLGKQAVQKWLALRFTDPQFETIWSKKWVDHISITLAESAGIGSRAGYYDRTGEMRDMVQNHGLQLVAATAMDPPENLSESAIRSARVRLLEQLRIGSFQTGQYAGYTSEAGVPPDSHTETLAALTLAIDNERWRGVPILLKTGKRLARKEASIAATFRPREAGTVPDVLRLNIQPQPGITGSVPIPSPTLTDEALNRSFTSSRDLDAYSFLLLRCLVGDQTYFIRRDEVEAAWRFMEPILNALPHQPPTSYPDSSNQLM